MAISFRPFLRMLLSNNVQRKTLFLSPQVHNVTMDEECQKLFYESGEVKAHVCYIRMGNIIQLDHTIIPEDFRGRGVGTVVAKNVLDYCVRNNIKVKITCPFLQSFYQVNMQRYQSIMI